MVCMTDGTSAYGCMVYCSMAYCSMAYTVVWHFADDNKLEVEWLKEGSLIASTDFHFEKQVPVYP